MIETRRSDTEERFLILYARVQELSDQDPSLVIATSRADPEFGRLCLDLSTLAGFLKRSEDDPAGFVRPVGKDFITCWRDYEKRYSSEVGRAFLEYLTGKHLPERRPVRLRGQVASAANPTLEQCHASADETAHDKQFALELLIDAVRDKWTDGGYDESAVEDWVRPGIGAWDFLQSGIGLDVRGIFRRKALVPFILFPHHVSAKYGESPIVSLPTLVTQAHQAFVFGVQYAAITLMRAILEAVLVNHYAADGINLIDKINHASENHQTVWRHKRELKALNRHANNILHTSDGNSPNDGGRDALPSEAEIAGYLGCLRFLIENAPTFRPPTRR